MYIPSTVSTSVVLRGTDGKFNRARNPLEGRTPPIDEGDSAVDNVQQHLAPQPTVGDSDWYKSGNKLTKSFFVYTAAVCTYY